MKVERLEPFPSKKFLFRYSEYKSIPRTAGCYVLSTVDSDILYIGLSNNLHNRFQQHLGSTDKVSMTPDGKAIWFCFLEFDPANLLKLERSWLNQYEALHGRKPILNKYNSPVG